MANGRINLDQIHNELKGRLAEYASIFFPDAKKQSKGFRMGDISGAKGDSLWFHDEGFIDHASGEKGSLIKLLSLHIGENIPKAARLIAEKLGLTIEVDDRQPEVKARNVTIEGLSEKHAAYIHKRGLDTEIAEGAGVGSASDGSIAFVHYDENGRPVGLKLLRPENKNWFAQPGSANVLWPLKYIVDNFPDSDTIYIVEGHWDALASIQAGFPALSIPNGANSLVWLETCFNFVHSFPKIVLCYDNDEAGSMGLVNATNRLSRGVEIIDLPENCKDLNDVLIKHGQKILGEVLANTKPYTPKNVVSAFSMIERAMEPEQYSFVHNTPLGINFPFQYRPHESTVLTARTGHGKSNWLRQTILGIAMEEDERCFIASFEDQPQIITRNLIQHMGPHTPKEEMERVLKNIALYDTRQLSHRDRKTNKVSVSEIIDLIAYHYKRYGYSHFVVDNIMTLQIDRQDLSAQSDASEAFRQLIISLPIHLHLVAHPRKPSENNSTKLVPPDPSEIRGASEIADAAFNIMGLVRNIPKEREIERMKFNGNGPDVIRNYDQSNPDAILWVTKQRATGMLPSAMLWFDHATRTYRNRYLK